MIRPNLQSFADELEKNASFLAKAVRVLATPIKGTPKLVMKNRSKVDLDVLEDKVRGGLHKHVNDNIYKGLKKARVDRLYQKLEPYIGSPTAPMAERARFGDRHIHAWANRPIHTLIGYLPIPYASTTHQAVTVAAQKLLKVPGARAYKMPEAVAEKIEAAVAKAPEAKRSSLRKKLLAGTALAGSGAGAGIGVNEHMEHKERQ